LLIEYAAEGFIEYDLNNGKIGIAQDRPISE
jgi:hypothetical protein